MVLVVSCLVLFVDILSLGVLNCVKVGYIIGIVLILLFLVELEWEMNMIGVFLIDGEFMLIGWMLVEELKVVCVEFEELKVENVDF